jgi:UDP-glucuronate 4-epimerase
MWGIMKILVTGAAGFVGSHLSSLLREEGNTVHGIDNLSSYYAPDLKNLRIEKLLNPANVQFTNLDLVEKSLLRNFLDKNNFDSVIHLAAQPGVRTPLNRSSEYIENNIQAFTNVLQLVTELGIPNFLYASSSSVYGNSKEIPYSESSEDIHPVSVYGATKRANELLAPTYVRGSSTRARGLRFFTVYGPWGRPDMAYFRLINSGINKTEFTRFGDGHVKRDFTYISDITQQISDLLKELQSQKKGFSDIVNIGGGNPHSLNDLIESVNSKLGSDIHVLTSDMNPNDTLYTCADVSLQKSLTGFVPKVSLSEGIKETIEWASSSDISLNLDRWVKSTN